MRCRHCHFPRGSENIIKKECGPRCFLTGSLAELLIAIGHCSSSSIRFPKLLKDYLRAGEILRQFLEKREASANGYE